MSELNRADLDALILDLGQTLFKTMSGETPGVFNKDYWQGRILEWAMKDPSFKVDMFRFVDVLPMLEDKEQVAKHIKEYLLKDDRELPGVMKAALKAASGGLTAGLGASAIKKNVTDMARRFIIGQDAKSALSVLKKLHKQGIAFTVDLLGEATVSEPEADAYAARYLDLIDGLSEATEKWSDDDVIDRNHLGPIPRTNVSLKMSAMYSQIDPLDPVGSVAALKQRILPLFLRAKERNVFLNIDLEQWSVHGITYDLLEELLGEPELKDYPHLGIVVQAYLRSADDDVERLLSLAKQRGAPLTVRLVKGAYWDYETVLAQQHGWDIPVYQDKAATDLCYERLTLRLLENTDHLLPAFGSHNLRSITNALVLAKELKVPERAFEVQMLYGMAEPERKVLRSLGHRVRVYAPVGDMLPGMAYLVRRLLENTSNAGFLRLTHHDGADTALMLRAPMPERDNPTTIAPMMPGVLTTAFASAPPIDFTDRERLAEFDRACQKARQTFPIQVPIVLGSLEQGGPAEVLIADRELRSCACPSDLSITVGQVAMAQPADAERAVEIAAKAFPAWRDRPLAERAQLIEELGVRLSDDRDALSALMVYEVGKPWASADADLTEAVDFCHYYARRASSELASKKQGQALGEDNQLFYEGRGPCVVIAPWNFPLAILCGMSTAALLAGNTVIMKPAEQSSAIAYALHQHMLAAGIPPEVVQFLPGDGEALGPVLVEHAKVAQLAFTGSRAVGLSIVERAAKVVPGQKEVKRVVCEMGGKNAIIVDDDADLDEAVLGVVDSAFSFAGQKCSACSRVLVHKKVADAFCARLVDAVSSLQIGPAHDPAFALGPVIDQEAQTRLVDIIRNPGTGAEPLYCGTAPDLGHFVPPAIFKVTDRQHVLMQQEFFGPLLAVYIVDDFAAGLDVANDTPFALTGGVYSRSPANLDLARRAFKVGNLYLNQPCTGALVGRQPFGGFGMSGIGTKAGGPGYLTLFANPRVVTENTMRRGFTPDLES